MQKYAILIADGCADLPQEALGGRTPLQAAGLPNLNSLAVKGQMGRARTVPEGVPPGSDTAILSIFGYDPRVYYTGRSPLEAAGAGVALRLGNLSLRMNLAGVEKTPEGVFMRSHSGGNIEGEEALSLMAALMEDASFAEHLRELGMRVAVSPNFRHVAVMESSPGDMSTTPPHEIVGREITSYLPSGAGEALRAMMLRSLEVLDEHPVNLSRRGQGKLAANMVWPWGQGGAVELPSFEELYGKTCAAVSAVPLVWGIAGLSGARVKKVATATGDIDTDYEGKADAAARALKDGADCVVIHIEAPDECSHDGNLEGKMEAMRRIDSRFLPRFLKGAEEMGADLRLLVLSDHYTLVSTRGHDGSPVPYLLYDSTQDTGSGQSFDEVSAAQGPMIDPGTRLIRMLFAEGSRKGYYDAQGRLAVWPSKPNAKREVLEKLAEAFAPGREYTQAEVGEILDALHTFNDRFLLRRELVDAGLLERTRDGAKYWRNV